MTSLYNRATPSQRRILRAVEGAVKNVADVHPDWINPRARKSIAKRAAGTLTAGWPDVLAARERALSDKTGNLSLGRCRCASAQTPKRNVRGALSGKHGRSPLRALEQHLARQMRDIKASGNTERANAFIDVLRAIADLRGAEHGR